MPWRLDEAKGWWSLLRDVTIVLVALSMGVFDVIIDPPADPIVLGLVGAAIAGVLGNRQDEKDRDGDA